MITRTEALLLRIAPFSRTSHIVTWLTPEQGQVGTIVKGACRPKSPFLGQYDYFYTCDLLYYTRDRNGLHIAKECCPLVSRSSFRSDWAAFGHASYICGLLSRASVEGGLHHELYALAQTSLDWLCAQGADARLVFWFELRLLGLLGLAPKLDRCAGCTSALQRHQAAVFSAGRGGALCETCVRGSPPREMLSLTPDVRAILAQWARTALPRMAAATRCTPHQRLVIRQILGTFLLYHLDLAAQGRAIALDMATA